MLRPDDVYEIQTEYSDANLAIRSWKDGLLRVIQNKILSQINYTEKSICKLPSQYFLPNLLDILNIWLKTKGVSANKAIRDEIFHLCQNKTINVYIDDLDRGWSASLQDKLKMSALLNALRDISREYTGIHFIISVRSDVYYLVRTSDESTDKLESSCIWFSWSNHEILAMLIKRIKHYFQLPIPDDTTLVSMKQDLLAKDLERIMTPFFEGKGRWEKIPIHKMLMSLIRKRPRDLVKLCSLAAKEAYDKNHNKIESSDFNSIFEHYSSDRLQDAINEYRSELPNIQALLENMKPSKKEFQQVRDNKKDKVSNYTTTELLEKLKNITQNQNFTFANSKNKCSPKDLPAFLYKIGFITANKRLDSGELDRKYFEEQNYLSSRFSDFGYNWEIHPAYRWALSPSTENIFSSIEI